MKGCTQTWADIVSLRKAAGPLEDLCRLCLKLGDDRLSAIWIVFSDVESIRFGLSSDQLAEGSSPGRAGLV